MERSMMAEMATRAMDELIRLAQARDHIWSKSPGGCVSGGDARETPQSRHLRQHLLQIRRLVPRAQHQRRGVLLVRPRAHERRRPRRRVHGHNV
uniref:START domain-containing protein n=1 Tax=Oryza punctata TaxID=4537 RepID=A0A0E0M7R1_ORYPU